MLSLILQLMSDVFFFAIITLLYVHFQTKRMFVDNEARNRSH